MKRMTQSLVVGTTLLGAASLAAAQDGKAAEPTTKQDPPAKAAAAHAEPKTDRVAALEQELGDLKKLVAALVAQSAQGSAGQAPAPEDGGTRKSVGNVDKPELGASIGGYFSLALAPVKRFDNASYLSTADAILLLEPLVNPVWTFLAHGEVPGKWAMVGGAIILSAITFQAVVPKRGEG